MSSLSLSRTAPALVALYAPGAVWATAAGFASFGEALLNGSSVNAPLLIVAAPRLGALLALRSPGRAAVGGAVLPRRAGGASLAALAFDGDLGHQGLAAPQVGGQVLISLTTAVTWIAAAGAPGRPRRRAARWDGAGGGAPRGDPGRPSLAWADPRR